MVIMCIKFGYTLDCTGSKFLKRHNVLHLNVAEMPCFIYPAVKLEKKKSLAVGRDLQNQRGIKNINPATRHHLVEMITLPGLPLG